jgi:ring-1,2-phenylacetyl-CoA epoxidase subunit PaaD
MLGAMTVSREQVFEALRAIPDPEMPISIVDLGLVDDVRIDPPLPSGEGLGVRAENRTSAQGDNGHESARRPSPQPSPTPSRRGSVVCIELLPTFIGCPALEMIAGDIRAKVAALPGVAEVRVNWIFDPPWSVDRITPAGRDSLREHGVSVPERGNHLHVPAHEAPQTVALRTSAIPCPFCGSKSTYLDSAFGPTRCRTIYYCQGCRNSFEHLKRV